MSDCYPNYPTLVSNQETSALTYIGLPEVPNFSSFLQDSLNVGSDPLEKSTTNVYLPSGGMEVGGSGWSKTTSKRFGVHHKMGKRNVRKSDVQIERGRMHSETERKRRERIRERIKILKQLIPHCDKTTGTAEVLDAAAKYIEVMQSQIQIMSMGSLFQNIQMGRYMPSGVLQPPPQAEAMMVTPTAMFQPIYTPPGMVLHQPHQSMQFNTLAQPVYTMVPPTTFVVPPNFQSSTYINQDC